MKRILLCLIGLFVSGVGFSQTPYLETMGTVSGTTAISVHNTAQGFDNDDWTFSGTGDLRATTVSTNYAGASGGANVFLTNNGTASFVITGINTEIFTSPEMLFGLYKSTTASDATELSIEYSTNGTDFYSLTMPAQATGGGTAVWRLVSVTGLPAHATLTLRFTNTSSTPQFRIDDIKIGSAGTLPVSATNFTAKSINKSILLSWQTLSEQDNKHFEIERSADGEIFTSLTTINGAGTSTEVNNYSYTDYAPLAGVNYYRLLQQDFNGTTSIVKTIAVNSQLNVNQLSVYTTASGVNVDLNAEKAGEATIAVYNFNGTKITERSFLLEAGLNNVALEADLLPGLYFVKVLANNEVSTVKFAK